MYRFLSSDWQDLTRFNGFALIAAVLGGLAGCLAGGLVTKDPLVSALGATFVFSAILYTTLTVRYQIEGAIRTLVMIEAVRVVILLSLVITLATTLNEAKVGMAIFALGASFLLPLLSRAHHLRFTLPEWSWVRSKIHFGYMSAAWLLLAGLPIALAKSMVGEHVSASELGAITANLDMYYRIFSILNIAIAMWAFPTMSAAYDGGDRDGARKIHLFALSVYFSGGACAIVAFLILIGLYQQFPATIAGGLYSFGAVLLACYLLQAMSLAHKGLEMSRRLIRMIILMALALLTFIATAVLLLGQTSVDPAAAVAIALSIAATSYLFGVLAASHGKSEKAEER